jgi:hypothetical protein
MERAQALLKQFEAYEPELILDEYGCIIAITLTIPIDSADKPLTDEAPDEDKQACAQGF